ncbi:rhomboid-like protein [Streptomyces sp. NRRL S-350]|uniref:rhomboid-like protein n=1 Tax=Streptomyces sp. NRRL S-350 TaxID=1463902 RepID=UPI00068CAB6D|nr:rhomboid-like protein [Streptomyces sp. NRRL S-350]
MNARSPRGLLSGLLRAVRSYPRRSPLTLGYVGLLVLGHIWVEGRLSADQADTVRAYLSTNLDNLHDHPITALLGSALLYDGTLTDVASTGFASTLITLGLGICCCLAWAERRFGRLRAAAVFLGGHIGATLVTAVVILTALRHGWYPDSVRADFDYGISYGAQATLAFATLALPRWARLPWAAFVVAWPLSGDSEWPGPLPDFTTVGHLVSAALGFALAGAAAVTAARRRRAEAAVPATADVHP